VRLGRCVRIRQREVRPAGARALEKQRDRRILRQPVEGWQGRGSGQPERLHDDLLLAPQAQALPACDQDLQPGGGGQQHGNLWRGVQQVLDVVEEQQDRPVAQLVRKSLDLWEVTTLADADGLGDRLDDEAGVAEGCQVDEIHSIGEGITSFGGNLDTQARLADIAWATQREQADVSAC
jgi:hypothetical protein